MRLTCPGCGARLATLATAAALATERAPAAGAAWTAAHAAHAADGRQHDLDAHEHAQQVVLDALGQVGPHAHREHEEPDGHGELVDAVADEVARHRPDDQLVGDAAESHQEDGTEQDRRLPTLERGGGGRCFRAVGVRTGAAHLPPR